MDFKLNGRSGFVGIALAFLNLGASLGFSATYYAAPNGSSHGNGSISSPWDLQSALNTGALAPGDTLWLRGGTYHGTYTSYLEGTASSPIVVRQVPGERAVIDGGNSGGHGIFTIIGNYTWFWGFEIMSSDPHRASAFANSAPTDIPRGEGVVFAQVAGHGIGTKLINLVIHDTRQGVSFWKEAENSEIYGCLIYNNGWDGPAGDRGHGHGIYTQNENGTKVIRDNIIFRQFGSGINQYGSGSSFLENYKYDGNIVFDNGEPSVFGLDRDVLVGGEIGSVATNVTFTNSFGYGSDWQFGYTGTISNTSISGNYAYADGTVMRINAGSGFKMSGNTWAGSLEGGSTSAYPSNAYIPYGSKPTGLHVTVRPNAYESGRGNVVIYNWNGQGTVSINPSAILHSGDSYEILDAQNYTGNPIARGTYTGSPISINLSQLSAVAQAIGDRVTVRHTSPQYEAFVIVRRP
jgi:hypothetical protein